MPVKERLYDICGPGQREGLEALDADDPHLPLYDERLLLDTPRPQDVAADGRESADADAAAAAAVSVWGDDDEPP
eukprot:gene10647-18821_t